MLSINLTIHNKDFLLLDSLERIKKFTRSTYEIVTVLDGCSDHSEEILDIWIKGNPSIKIHKLYADNVFETKSNNLAAKSSQGEFVAIIQDDMLINEDGWDVRMLKPFHAFSDVFSVTSHTSHNWMFNSGSHHVHLDQIPRGIWSDVLQHVDHAHCKNTARDCFEIRDSSNRGPLVINHLDLEKMGYFDEEFYPLDMDDHDLHYRMQKKLGKVTGLYWIDFISDTYWGGTRENGIPKQWHLDANHKNQRIIYNRHLDVLNGRRKETRALC
jgi:glycosyltransferase involved in cell wall biosynthesis